MILLDTCALLWWVFDKNMFSKKAISYIKKMEGSSGHVSSISFWEIGIKIIKERIEIPVSIEELVDKIKLSGLIKIAPVDESIWIHSLKLKWSNQDPADRVIVATATTLNVPIITSDKRIRKFHKNCVW
ncbi:MAG: type II toxin-antitoxin system VapC family toxin [Candidatus Anammoxibacter sp.]